MNLIKKLNEVLSSSEVPELEQTYKDELMSPEDRDYTEGVNEFLKHIKTIKNPMFLSGVFKALELILDHQLNLTSIKRVYKFIVNRDALMQRIIKTTDKLEDQYNDEDLL